MTTISSLASPLKSPTATDWGPVPLPRSDGFNETEEVDRVTSKKTTFEAPPPGAGLTTVTAAVLALATSAARMVAVSLELLTNEVTRGLVFQFTTEPGTKPVPFTVNVKPLAPGTTAVGTNGWSRNGTGFSAVAALTLIASELPETDAVTVSVALMDWVPIVFNVAAKFAVPPVRAEFAGKMAWGSELEKCMVPM